jgi:hypothetical protein
VQCGAHHERNLAQQLPSFKGAIVHRPQLLQLMHAHCRLSTALPVSMRGRSVRAAVAEHPVRAWAALHSHWLAAIAAP